MSLNRYAKARDANERAIVLALIRAGATVCRLDEPCDLLVGYAGRTHLVEVKRPPGPRGGTSDRELTEKQQMFWNAWKGSPVHIVTDVREALRVIGVAMV